MFLLMSRLPCLAVAANGFSGIAAIAHFSR